MENDITINSRNAAAVVTLVASSLTWSFFILFSYDFIFESFVNSISWVYIGEAIFLSSSALSAIVGSFLGSRINRGKFSIIWISLGVVASIFSAIFPETIFTFSSVLFGVSLGLGYPCFTAYLADCTRIEERARISGIVILLTFLLTVIAIGIATILQIGLMGFAIISILLRSISYLSLKLDNCERVVGKEKSWLAVLADKNLSLYLFPWLMVCIGSSLTAFVWTGLGAEYETATKIGNIFHYLGAGVSGLIAGIVADRSGRKLPIRVGLITLAISFAVMGIFSSPIAFAIYLGLSGIAWGLLIVPYLTIPGDLSTAGSREKYYALGIVIPLIIFMGLPTVANILGISIPANTLTNALSIILILSLVPAYLAKETLKEEKIAERRMKDHLENIEKIIKKNMD